MLCYLFFPIKMTMFLNSNTSYKWGLTRSSSNERDLERVARNNGVSQIRLHCRRNPFQECQVFAFILSRILVTEAFAVLALLQICLVEKVPWIIQSRFRRIWIVDLNIWIAFLLSSYIFLYPFYLDNTTYICTANSTTLLYWDSCYGSAAGSKWHSHS